MNESLNPLYKVYILDKQGNPSELLIFNRKKENYTYDDAIFDENEKMNLEKYNVSIKTCFQNILLDDSIRSIKRKLLKETGFNQYSYEELYYFANIYPTLDPKNKGISKAKLGQILMNLQLLDQLQDLDSLVGIDNELYNYREIESIMKINNSDLVLPFPLGHSFDKQDDILFSANPFFNLPSSESIFEMSIENPLLTFENSLLLNYPSLHNNTIYVCLAENVLDYAEKNGLSGLNMLQYYFPLLITKNVDSNTTLQEKKQNLISETKSMF